MGGGHLGHDRAARRADGARARRASPSRPPPSAWRGPSAGRPAPRSRPPGASRGSRAAGPGAAEVLLDVEDARRDVEGLLRELAAGAAVVLGGGRLVGREAQRGAAGRRRTPTSAAVRAGPAPPCRTAAPPALFRAGRSGCRPGRGRRDSGGRPRRWWARPDGTARRLRSARRRPSRPGSRPRRRSAPGRSIGARRRASVRRRRSRARCRGGSRRGGPCPPLSAATPPSRRGSRGNGPRRSTYGSSGSARCHTSKRDPQWAQRCCSLRSVGGGRRAVDRRGRPWIHSNRAVASADGWAQVLLAQGAEMAQLVPRDVEGEAAHGGGVVAHDAAPQPGLGGEAGEEGEGGVAHRAVVGEQAGQGTRLEAGGGDVGLLVEGGERSGVAPRDAQRAIGEDALVVGEVAEDLLQRPLARRVGEPLDRVLRGTRRGGRSRASGPPAPRRHRRRRPGRCPASRRRRSRRRWAARRSFATMGSREVHGHLATDHQSALNRNGKVAGVCARCCGRKPRRTTLPLP